MAKSSNYSILVDATLDLDAIEKKLNSKKFTIPLDTSGVKSGKKDIDDAVQSTKKLNNSGKDLELTFNVANEVFNKFTSVIKDMAGQVYELDDALTEFKKVSTLNGQALDEYTDKLSKIGQTVGRTGKPNRSEPVCTNGKCA
nr:MAG TPA: hypothetical protein [Caudoviricetes sp.]